MTALYFAIQHGEPDCDGEVKKTDGAVFAVDVTDMKWYETFQHTGERTYDEVARALTAPWERALDVSAEEGRLFRAFPALPDERMKAQEGFFLGSVVPSTHLAEGVREINDVEPAAGRRPTPQAAGPGSPGPRAPGPGPVHSDRHPTGGQGEDPQPAQAHLQPPAPSDVPRRRRVPRSSGQRAAGLTRRAVADGRVREFHTRTGAAPWLRPRLDSRPHLGMSGSTRPRSVVAGAS